MSRQGVLGLALAASVLVAAAGPAALADVVSRQVQDVTTIDDGAGNSRILFTVAAPADSSILIKQARLTFPVAGASGAEKVRLRVHPVTTAWTQSAGWSSPWSRAGGDFPDDVYSRAELDVSRSGSASVDLTRVVKEAMEFGLDATGFILTTDPVEREGISTEDVAAFTNFSTGTVEIRYRKVPPARGR